MEHWSHRLFPRLKFNDVVEKIEVLGTKRPVQNCLRKLRLEMPILASDFVDDDDDNDDERAEPTQQVPEKDNVTFVDDDIFDKIFGDVKSATASTTYTDETQSSQPAQPSETLTLEERQRIAMNRLKALEKLNFLREKSQQQTTDTNTETQPNDGNLPADDIPFDEENDFLTESEMFEFMEQDGGLS